MPVIPDPVIPVEEKTGQQFDHSDNSSSGKSPEGQGEPGLGFIQLPQKEKTGAAGKEHTEMAPPPPQVFQPNIAGASQAKKQNWLDNFHV